MSVTVYVIEQYSKATGKYESLDIQDIDDYETAIEIMRHLESERNQRGLCLLEEIRSKKNVIRRVVKYGEM